MIDPVSVGILGTIGLFVLLFLGMPIAFALFLIGFCGITYLTSLQAAMPVLSSTVYAVSSFYPYIVIPLFIVMGALAGTSGMTKELYTAFEKWLRRLPGGLGIATIAACGGFAAVSGSSVATAAAMGTVAYPEMKRYDYKPTLSTGCIAAGGTLGFLIPPSIGFIVYGMLTEQSIGKLLIAGIIPGILLTAAYVIIILIMVKIRPDLAPAHPAKASWREKFLALYGVWEPLAVFIVAIGGIYTGIFTPTEAGAVGATILFGIALAKRKISLSNLYQALLNTMRISVMVLLLVAGANVFSYFLALTTIPMQAASWAANLQTSPYIILILFIIMYLFLGCFLDAISMMVLTMPVIFPVILELGFHPIWFGVIAVLMMEAGLITPPMGLNIFTVAGVARTVPIEVIFRGVFPFLLSIFFIVALITFFPNIVLFLPGAM